MIVSEPQRPEPPVLRASDADRDQVAEELREALVEGRLTPDEHAERLDAVYAAKTYAELAPIVEDLPAPASGRPDLTARPIVQHAGADVAPHQESGTIAAFFGEAKRAGRWLVPASSNVTAAFGGVELDFRQAVLSHREVRININAFFGGVELKIPPGVRVVNSITGIFGGSSAPADDTDDATAPVIRLTGLALFGGVDAKRRSSTTNQPSGKSRRAEIRARQRERRELSRERRRTLGQTRRERP